MFNTDINEVCEKSGRVVEGQDSARTPEPMPARHVLAEHPLPTSHIGALICLN